MDKVYYYINQNSTWLYAKIYSNEIFFFDFWSLAHLWCGFFVLVIITASGLKKSWIWLLVFLFGYEIIEMFFIYLAVHVFNPETIKDQFTDIFVGLLGGGLSYSYIKWETKSENPKMLNRIISSLFAAETLAFVFTGSYQYRYNYEVINSFPINYFAYIAWFSGGYLLLWIYRSLKKYCKSYSIIPLAIWLIFISSLCLVEFLGHAALGIEGRAFGAGRDLFYGFMIGSRTLQIYYLIYPLLLIILYELLMVIFKKVNIAHDIKP